MANTACQLECEDWVRLNWLPAQFGGQTFFRERLRLNSGGVFDFDAVNSDRSIAISISTSGANTASGKRGAGKLFKLRSDMLFLLMATVSRRVLVLTERDMYELCMKERAAGRVPDGIEFLHAPLPPDLCERLIEARRASSNEVSPKAESTNGEDEMTQRIKRATPTNAALLKAARSSPPPLSWSDEDVDPFKANEGN